MNTQPSPTAKRPPLFLPVILAAALIATLFTAWTEPGLLPSTLAQSFNAALEQNSTPAGDWPTPTPRPRPLVGIVAGHSGNDTGAVCPPELNNTREVDINLDVAQRVRNLLVEEGYDVELLSEFDERLNGYQAAALVSIHSDSCIYVNDQATGFKVAPAMSTVYPEQAVRLNNCLRDRYSQITGMAFHAGSVTIDMTSYHAFDEINPQTPASIIEIGFMNLDHEILTRQPDIVARGVTRGILCYLRNESITPEE